MDDRPESMPASLAARLRDLPPHEREDLAHAWTAAGRLVEAEPSDDVVRAWGGTVWEGVRRETGADRGHARLRLISARRTGWLAVAAALALLVAVGVGFWLRPVTATAPVGERLMITLSDGSVVELNAGSRLSYTRRLGPAARAVRLEGEAYLEVQPASAPFRVETFNANVTVLGTKFNVRAWPEEPEARTEVTLTHGRVRLASRDGQRSVDLEPGEYSELAETAQAPSAPVPVQVSTSLAWREEGFVLVDRSLAVVLAELQRRFGVEVAVEHSEMLDEKLSVLAGSPSRAETILQDIGQYLGYEVEQTDEGYVLRRP